jgi:hypothetical protein
LNHLTFPLAMSVTFLVDLRGNQHDPVACKRIKQRNPGKIKAHRRRSVDAKIKPEEYKT